jgi:hypothetical protein
MLPQVVEKEPRAQKWRPQVRLRMSGNSLCSRCDERPLTRRTKSLTDDAAGFPPTYGHVLARQNAGDDLDAQFFADLPDNRSYPLPQRDFLHLVAILRDDKLCQMAT